MSLFPIPKLADLLEDPGKASSLPAEAIPELRGQLAKLDTLLLCRLLGANSNGNPSTPAGRNLGVKEASQKIGVSQDWLYRKAGELPFTVRIGRRVLFSESGIEKYIRQRMGR